LHDGILMSIYIVYVSQAVPFIRISIDILSITIDCNSVARMQKKCSVCNNSKESIFRVIFIAHFVKQFLSVQSKRSQVLRIFFWVDKSPAADATGAPQP
jgi:hypothetical protein